MKFRNPYYRLALSLLLLAVLLLQNLVGLSNSARANATQVTFSKHIVDPGFGSPEYGHAIDVDGDEDVDILEVSDYGHVVAWWENDGFQQFSRHTIGDIRNRGGTVYGADIDGDEDIDVLVSTNHEVNGAVAGEIAWWENDGSQQFKEHVIAAMDLARSAYADDLDLDGDIDILGVSSLGFAIWWENDGNEEFIAHTLADNLNNSNWVRTVDMDGDDDVDVLAASGGGVAFAWLENDGNQNFTTHLKGSGSLVKTAFPADVDSDGDIDVLTADQAADEITWWENDGTQGFTEHIIAGPDLVDAPSEAYPADLDNDGDIDVIGAITHTGFVGWWENDGAQYFAQHIVDGNFWSTQFAEGADIDRDGDLDIVASSYNYADIVWYENLMSPNTAPTVDAGGPYLVAVGNTIALDGAGSDPDQDPLGFLWTATSGSFDDATLEDPAYTAGYEAGIFDLTLTVTDPGGLSASDTAIVVVYDPDGGFVTGGGWIDSPEGAFNFETTSFFNDFETDIDGWFNLARVESGTDDIISASGDYHAKTGPTSGGAVFTRWGGYNSAFPPGGYSTSIGIYLDVDGDFENDARFDWTSAINSPDGNHRRDFIFNGGYYNDNAGPGAGFNRFVFSASNNAPGWPKNPDRDPIAITESGWYTLWHRFYDGGDGVLAVDLSILDGVGNLIHTWTLSDPTDIIGVTVGGNRYGWFATNDFPFFAIDNSLRTEIHSPTGKATFGFVSKYKKGANAPTGNTEFVFKAADLNFHSTSYDWLVVTGSDYAKFKGSGTINGGLDPNGNEYRFMLWAGDGDPDTFRIKIWWEEDDTEHVIYDNGMAQPIGGGSIVIHTSKK